MDLKSGLIEQKIDEDKRVKELEKNKILITYQRTGDS